MQSRVQCSGGSGLVLGMLNVFQLPTTLAGFHSGARACRVRQDAVFVLSLFRYARLGWVWSDAPGGCAVPRPCLWVLVFFRADVASTGTRLVGVILFSDCLDLIVTYHE